MSSTDIERLSQLMLDEFQRVHERFERIDQHFDEQNERFDDIEEQLMGVRREVKSLRDDLDAIAEQIGNVVGYRKEIDHALERIAKLERTVQDLKGNHQMR